MTVFYQALKSGNLTKIQALQQAQMELINSKISSSNQKRASIIVTLQEGGVSEAVMAQLDHPYYGSSFILIGNG
jgi:CHAT domain-containing protein